MADSQDPLAEYSARRQHWSARQTILQQQFVRLGNWRLIVAIAAAALAWFAFGANSVSGRWLLIPLCVFVAISVALERVNRGSTLARRAIRYYERGLARLVDKWSGTGETGERFRDGEHVYSEDLDIFGKGSLFELLCTARTAAGEDVMAEWLLHAAPYSIALSRQEAIRDFRSRLDLREDLALLGEDVRSGVHAARLTQWGSSPPVRFSLVLQPLAVVLGCMGVAAFFAFIFQRLPLWPFLALFACDFAIAFFIRKQVEQIAGAVDLAAQDLTVLALMIGRINQEQFDAPFLKESSSKLHVSGVPVAKRIAQLERRIGSLGGDHPIVKAVRLVVLMQERAAMSIESWRRENGPHIGLWIRTLGEFEAVSSFASLAFERSDWVFPQLLSTPAPEFAAQGLRHPLIPRATCVANDVQLDATARLLIVSGSNMSGKSTLLRAIGLNTVLARAGSVVAATDLRVSPLETGASIRATDSLQDNRSRFFAEITRLRQIVDLAKEGREVLFLLDELLSGTNSHDRKIGASGIVRGLLARKSIGLITTHDLALAEIARDAGSNATNVHFEDQVVNGRLEFDYRLRPGIVTRSNALELMRSIGLEI